MDWIVGLNGDELDLQELAKVWNCPEITIEKDNTSYVLKSTHFASLTSDQDVREKANELLIPLNAGIKLELDSPKPVEITHTIQINPNGTRIALQLCYEVVGVRNLTQIATFTKEGIKEVYNPADPVVSLFNLAQSDSQVAKICQYVNLDLNSWFTLYNILEILEEDKFKPIMRNGCHKGKADDLTRTANSYKILGSKSRHAKRNNAIIKNPLSLPEARSFIMMLIREWLDEKRTKIS
ncbi:hypothetical protein [Methanoregula sp.]|uniref:hypothetical protein n=1 Tax=Methanoregula sp. TaxID=2052170 RepID=UPI00356880F7